MERCLPVPKKVMDTIHGSIDRSRLEPTVCDVYLAEREKSVSFSENEMRRLYGVATPFSSVWSIRKIKIGVWCWLGTVFGVEQSKNESRRLVLAWQARSSVCSNRKIKVGFWCDVKSKTKLGV